MKIAITRGSTFETASTRSPFIFFREFRDWMRTKNFKKATKHFSNEKETLCDSFQMSTVRRFGKSVIKLGSALSDIEHARPELIYIYIWKRLFFMNKVGSFGRTWKTLSIISCPWRKIVYSIKKDQPIRSCIG